MKASLIYYTFSAYLSNSFNRQRSIKMSSYTLREDHLEEALEKLCDKLIEKGAMKPEDKQHAIEMVKNALVNAYPDGVPQDLFTDPVKQKTLLVGLISAPLMENNPALKFDLTLFFKAEFQPQEVKTLFKTFLTELNKLEPDPNKRRSEKEIEAETEALLEKIAQEKQKKLEEGESLRVVDSPAVSNELEDIFETLFGMTQFGVAVVLSVNKGNTAGIIDSYSASNTGRGSIHEGRGLAGDSTTDPYVTQMAKERLLDLGGLGAEVLNDLTNSGIIHKPLTPHPPTAR
ncbi:MAG: hypothetical protein K0S27_619 [Gammaproteobacteria bacterium]|jgi:hypothetical protein|nr:hypothetical protein [Gammaproteobacteria bacterium]